MTHILGNYIPENKSLSVSLTSIHGIGRKRAIRFCKEVGLNPNKKITDLNEEQLAHLIAEIDSQGSSLDSELQRAIFLQIQELVDIQAYRGVRHSKGLPLRGQRTTTNSRTQRRLGLRRLRR